NVAQRTENDGTVVSTIYDAAGRLSCTGQGVIVMSSGTCANGWSVPTTYIQNFYDGNGFAGGNNPLGKLTRQVGSNPLVSPFPTTTDDFTYSGLGGRVSMLSTTVSGGVLGRVDQTWAYNGLGLMIQHVHPRPSSGALAPLVESITYDAGLPVAIYANGLPVATSIDYAASGALNHYTTGLFSSKTATTTITADASLMPRPGSITPPASLQRNYVYDGVGNIKTAGDETYDYDSLSRLTDGTI